MRIFDFRSKKKNANVSPIRLYSSNGYTTPIYVHCQYRLVVDILLWHNQVASALRLAKLLSIHCFETKSLAHQLIAYARMLVAIHDLLSLDQVERVRNIPDCVFSIQ